MALRTVCCVAVREHTLTDGILLSKAWSDQSLVGHFAPSLHSWFGSRSSGEMVQATSRLLSTDSRLTNSTTDGFPACGLYSSLRHPVLRGKQCYAGDHGRGGVIVPCGEI